MIKFIKSSSKKENWYKENNKEICFIGRSNVGKSSLLNSIFNQKIAKISKMPGRTQLINFFELNNRILVDLPGYGYAKLSKQKLNEINQMLNEYFEHRTQLICVFLLVDIKIGLTPDDIKMIKYLEYYNKNYKIIGTKLDKASQKQKNSTIKQIEEITNDYILTSSLKGDNINKMKKIIEKIL